jgi:NAD(P)-dependent dehydrogenase (short-subunit alcohol dehydrogenase family)
VSDWQNATSSLAGKVVMITGGAQGLGEATARLAKERGAAGLVIVDRNRELGAAVAADLDGDGCRAIFVGADLADANDCLAAIAAADAEFGVLHGVVNAAAVTDRGTVWDTTVELWDVLHNVNVRAPFLLMQGAAKIMRREGVPGSMITIGSTTGYGGQPYLTPYAVSKGALATMTRNLAYALMRHHIRVNQVSLGWMDTPAEDRMQRQYHDADDGWLQRAEAAQPYGRLLKPIEIARVFCFLLSDESGVMSGAILDVAQSVLGAGEPSVPPASLGA